MMALNVLTKGLIGLVFPIGTIFLYLLLTKNLRHLLRLRRLPRSENRKGCRFLSADGCSIHPVKPTQCRTYPYWPSLVESRALWAQEAKFCPGIGKGDLVQINEARAIARELPAAFPTLNSF